MQDVDAIIDFHMLILRRRAIIAQGLLAMMLVSTGCSTQSAPVATPPSMPESQDAPIPVGVPQRLIASADHGWQAYYVIDDSEAMSMVLNGPNFRTSSPRSMPLSFSPDNSMFVFSGQPDGLAPGLYSMALQAPFSIKRLTNIGMQHSTGKLPDTYVPVPENEIITWVGNQIKYSIIGMGTFNIDVNSGAVIHVP